MKALQYIYTSWKNGNSTEKGYMIYSRSEGISEEECTAIKDAMQYLAPKELSLAPTPQEIAEVFPYSFAYFQLPTGRGCIAQSTYLGRDYSGRFGNYIIYALVLDEQDLPCRPAEFFGEPYIKTSMTEEELNAPSPVPPLPPLNITQYGSVVNEEQLTEFLLDKEEEFALVIAMVLAAADAGVPFYLNDTRENLVLWAAAFQRILPMSLARKFTFNTYVGDQEALRSPRIRQEGLNFYLIGVRPDANYFNYATECRSNRQVVLDFLGNHMTEGITPNRFARAMASSFTIDCEEINAFGDFLEQTRFREISSYLEDAYLYFQLLKKNEFSFQEEDIRAMLAFGERYCSEVDNAEFGTHLLENLQNTSHVLAPETFTALWSFICRYTSFLALSLFDLLQETLYQYSGEAAGPCIELQELLAKLQESAPTYYTQLLQYMNTPDSVDQLKLYLNGHTNLYTNEFYLKWVLVSYRFTDGLEDRQPIAGLVQILLNNIVQIPNSEKLMMEILLNTTRQPAIFRSILQLLLVNLRSDSRIDNLCDQYATLVKDLPAREQEAFEQLLLDNEVAFPFAIKLFARKISAADKPDEDFWQFYRRNRNRILASGLNIDSLIQACLNGVTHTAREKVTFDMLRDLDRSLLQSTATQHQLLEILDECSIKILAKLDSGQLKQAAQMAVHLGGGTGAKVLAVSVGEELENEAAQHKRPLALGTKIAPLGVTLASLERAEYDTYLKKYFDDFLGLVYSVEDVYIFLQVFYNGRHFSAFTSDYAAALKKLEKRRPERWQQLCSWTCIYLIQSEDQSAEALYPAFIRYLRTVEPDSLYPVRRETAAQVSESRSNQFFDEVNRKEGFYEKLGGFFRRK